jgi:hypothetical protein
MLWKKNWIIFPTSKFIVTIKILMGISIYVVHHQKIVYKYNNFVKVVRWKWNNRNHGGANGITQAIPACFFYCFCDCFWKNILKFFFENCLETSVTMFNECFCLFFTHWINCNSYVLVIYQKYNYINKSYNFNAKHKISSSISTYLY